MSKIRESYSDLLSVRSTEAHHTLKSLSICLKWPLMNNISVRGSTLPHLAPLNIVSVSLHTLTYTLCVMLTQSASLIGTLRWPLNPLLLQFSQTKLIGTLCVSLSQPFTHFSLRFLSQRLFTLTNNSNWTSLSLIASPERLFAVLSVQIFVKFYY